MRGPARAERNMRGRRTRPSLLSWNRTRGFPSQARPHNPISTNLPKPCPTILTLPKDLRQHHGTQWDFAPHRHVRPSALALTFPKTRALWPEFSSDQSTQLSDATDHLWSVADFVTLPLRLGRVLAFGMSGSHPARLLFCNEHMRPRR